MSENPKIRENGTDVQSPTPANGGAAFKAWAKPRIKRLFPLLCTAFAVPFILFVSVPLDIFAHNRAEFVFVWGDFMPQCLLFAFAATMLLALLLFVLPHRAYRVASGMLIGIAFMLFLQGTFLNGSMSSLAGDNNAGAQVVTGKNKVRIVFNSLLWAAVICGMAVAGFSDDKKGIARIISYVLLAVALITQLMSVTVLSFSDPGVYASAAKKEQKLGKYYALTDKNVTATARESNIYYFVIDRFDQVYAESAFARHPEWLDEYTGFTWFTDNISQYSNTFPAIAHMLTDRLYPAEKLRGEYFAECYGADGNPLQQLSEAGYRIDLYTQAYYAYNYNGESIPQYVDNYTKGSYKAEKKLELFGRTLKMSLFRCLPKTLKLQLSGNIDSSTCNRCVNFYGEDGAPLHESLNRPFLSRVQSTPFDEQGDKLFSFVHIDGCHAAPITASRTDVSESVRESIDGSVRESLDVVDAFIRELKTRGLYERATIVITGDHGAWLNREGKLRDGVRTAMFVKPRFAGGGELRTSEAPVCHADVWPTIFKSEELGGTFSQNKSMFEYAEDEARTRLYINQTYLRGNLTEYYYDVKGNAEDFANWTLDESRTKHFNRHIMA